MKKTLAKKQSSLPLLPATSAAFTEPVGKDNCAVSPHDFIREELESAEPAAPVVAPPAFPTTYLLTSTWQRVFLESFFKDGWVVVNVDRRKVVNDDGEKSEELDYKMGHPEINKSLPQGYASARNADRNATSQILAVLRVAADEMRREEIKKVKSAPQPAPAEKPPLNWKKLLILFGAIAAWIFALTR